ncbi:hypothetical protein MMC22_004970 [Lobaria immixta]|nr:hypothetical protein [Lobaria immixta]
MSASPKHSRFVNSPPHHLSYHRQYSLSPESARSTSSKPTAAQSRDAQNVKSRPPHLQREESTPTARTDIQTPRSSLRLTGDAHVLREGSNDELSSNTQDSPEAQHLTAGAPGIARRAKAHVPSACVNCKRKHLACETRRPCNRCVQTGKESTCVDVQHKKRGRPRLREEDSTREVDFGRDYPHQEIYPNRNGVLSVPQVGRRRSKSYRELRSQPGVYYNDQPQRTSNPEYAIQQHIPNTSRIPVSPTASYLSESTPTVLLTPDFLVAEHNHAFADALSLPYQIKGQSLAELVIPAEREKIQRVHMALRAELLDSSHLVHMRGNFDGPNGMPAIENLDLGHATAGFRPRSEYWTFRLPKGQSRGFPITISLARTGAHFIVLTLVQSAMMLPSPHLSQNVRSQQLPSPSSTQGPRSPPQVHQSHPRNGQSRANMAYSTQLSPQKTSAPDPRTLLMQPSPSVGLGQYRQSSPTRTQARTTVLPYGIPRGHSSTEEPRGSQIQRSDAVRDHPSHLQLPPIRTSELTEPSRSHEGRSEHRHGKQSPAKGSPQSGRKKKRRRVDIGEILH